jgi:glycosyltransferase involved in cell wall biosynthesis
MAELPEVRVLGWLPDIEPVLQQARVSVVPLRYGAGVKGKLLNTMAVGTPAVSTSVGAEGIGVEPGTHVLIADDPREFASAVEALIRDPALWGRLVEQAQRYITANHSREVVASHFWQAVEAVFRL